jgi:hypothetical protein
MADGLTLQGALSGMSISPMENYYGIGTQVLGQSLPALVNPYGSFGSNLTTVLGGALLQGLLGYQARQEATQQNLEVGRLAAQMTALPSATERVNFLSGVDADSQVMNRLSSLQTALQGQEMLGNANIQQQIAQRKALAPIELEIQQAADRGMTLEEFQAAKPQLEQIRKARLAQALSTATTGGEITQAARELTSDILFKEADAIRPNPKDIDIIGVAEYKRRKEQFDAFMTQGRAALQSEREKRVGDAQVRELEERTKTQLSEREQRARSDKIHVEVADRLRESNALLRLSEQAMASNDPVIVQKLIKASEKPIEQNAVTLGEFDVIQRAQPLAQSWIAELKKQVGSGSGYDPKLVQSLRDYLKNVNIANQQLYDQQRDVTASTYKVDPESIKLVAPLVPLAAKPMQAPGLDYIKNVQVKYGPQWKQLMTPEERAGVISAWKATKGQ